MSKVYPNLFIVGAMKSATTSLHEYLNFHPEIYMSDMKEPGYFVEEVDNIPDNIDAYLELFTQGKGCRIVGESSTHYTKLPTSQGAAERIDAFCQNAKINPKFIYLMRDPIKRTVSHYWHNVKKQDEYRAILPAIEAQDKNEYIAFSDYAMQLEPYLETFGKENVFVLTFEELIEQTDHKLREIFTWLGVDATIDLPAQKGKHNAMPDQFNKVRGKGKLHRFRNNPVWNSISPLVPKFLKRKAISLSVKSVSQDKADDAEIFEYLKPIFQEKVKNLEKMLDRKFPEWVSLW